MSLPPEYTLRHPTEADIVLAHDLMQAVDLAEVGQADDMLEDLRSEWAEADLAADAWVIEAPDGTLAAYALLSHHDHTDLTADVYTHPAHLERGLGTAINRAIEARAVEHAALLPPGEAASLATYVNGTSTAAPALLANEGYAIARHFWRMTIDLDAPPPAPDWPDGIVAHTFVPGDDEARTHAAVTEAFADMWNHTPSSLAEWRGFMIERADFDPTLWTLALDGDEVAGVCLAYQFPDRSWVRSLGIHRPWRRRGLALALLRHTLSLFWARGERQIGLGVDAASPTGATHLYEHAGMRVTRTFARWEKRVRG